MGSKSNSYKKICGNQKKRLQNIKKLLKEKNNEIYKLKELLKMEQLKQVEETNKEQVEQVEETNKEQVDQVEEINKKTVEETNKKTVEETNKKTVEETNKKTVEEINKKTVEETNKKTVEETNKETNSFTTVATNLINEKHKKKQKRDIWSNSKWKNISELENDDVGNVGEEIINEFCKLSQIVSDIDGTKTKKIGGGLGDGIIKGKSCEIKTARLGSSGSSFQHELGEVPWNADYMIFLDISPNKMYITIFKNFTEEFYKKSGTDSSNKCIPYFPTKSITWRKQKGAFKLDTTIAINEKNKYTFIIDESMSIIDNPKFKLFVDSIIH
jgi:hypothetical protein